MSCRELRFSITEVNGKKAVGKEGCDENRASTGLMDRSGRREQPSSEVDGSGLYQLGIEQGLVTARKTLP